MKTDRLETMYTAQEVAAYLTEQGMPVSYRRVLDALDSGELHYIDFSAGGSDKKFSRSRRITQSAVQDWLVALKNPAKEEPKIIL